MNKDSLDILKKMGNGFTTPEGYFKDVEDGIIAKLSVEKFPSKVGFNMPSDYLDTIEDNVLETIGIDENSEKHALNVPEGYFDSIEDRVFTKIQEETIEKPKVISLRSRMVKVAVPIAIAASLLLVFVLNSKNEIYSIDNLATSDIEEWIEADLVALDSYEIAELYNDTSFEDEFSDDDLEVLDYISGTDIESVLLTD